MIDAIFRILGGAQQTSAPAATKPPVDGNMLNQNFVQALQNVKDPSLNIAWNPNVDNKSQPIKVSDLLENVTQDGKHLQKVAQAPAQDNEQDNAQNAAEQPNRANDAVPKPTFNNPFPWFNAARSAVQPAGATQNNPFVQQMQNTAARTNPATMTDFISAMRTQAA